MNICFYDVDLDYIDFLKSYERQKRGFTRVPDIEYESGNNKFLYGAVLSVNSIHYFVPISSKKHEKQDDMLIRIKDKAGSIAGTLRFAYMLSVPDFCLKIHNIPKIENYSQRERCRKELAFCRRNRDKIQKQAQKTYDRIISKVNKSLLDNSCDFEILEEAYLIYISKKDEQK